jgi:hypothetical protein
MANATGRPRRSPTARDNSGNSDSLGPLDRLPGGNLTYNGRIGGPEYLFKTAHQVSHCTS